MASKRGCLDSVGCLLVAVVLIAAGCFLARGCFTAVEHGVANVQRQIDESYGEPGSTFTELHVKQKAESAVRSFLQHPLAASFLNEDAKRWVSDEFSNDAVVWTCTGTVSSPVELQIPQQFLVTMKLQSKEQKTWQVATVTIGEKTFTAKADK